MRIMEEPTAAAVAYGLHKQRDVRHILVFDFGGGTLDVSLLFSQDDAITVLTSAGDNHLGGSDMDACLAEHLRSVVGLPEHAEQCEHRSALHDCQWEGLRAVAEEAKIALSHQPEAKWQCVDSSTPPSGPPTCYGGRLARADFEEACADVFGAVEAVVLRAMDDAMLRPDDVDAVVLVGGSSRIPQVRDMLVGVFGKRKTHWDIDPDLAVAIGLASIVD
jgi:molecular chaperone DnaK (HSP70)